jgi:hypothetical protein
MWLWSETQGVVQNRLLVHWVKNDNPGARTYELRWEYWDAPNPTWQHTVYTTKIDGVYHYSVTHPIRFNHFTSDEYIEDCVEIERRYRESDPYLWEFIPTIINTGD